MKTNVLIVGSGCSGLYTALNLPQELHITIISKDTLEHSDSFLAQGGICMLKDESDYDSFLKILCVLVTTKITKFLLI